MLLDELPVRAAYAGRYRSDDAWSLGPDRTRTWRDLALWLLVDGYGRVGHAGTWHPLTPGTCLLLCGGKDYSIEPMPGIRLGHWFVHFSPLAADGSPIPTNRLALPPLSRRLSEPSRATAIWERLVASLPQDQRRADHWLSALLQEVSVQELAATARTGMPASEIDEAARAMREQPQARHSIAAMARRLGLGRQRFRRLFRERHHASPREYLTTQRLQLAGHLLTDSSSSIAAIAEEAGYSCPFFFSRQFRRHTGMSPRAYRHVATAGVRFR